MPAAIRLIWDDANREHATRHGVSLGEIVDMTENGPWVIVGDTKGRQEKAAVERDHSMAGNKTDDPLEEDRSLRPLDERDNLDDWELIADSSDTEIALVFRISFTPQESRLIARAERVGDLDVFEVAKQAVLERARALAGEEAAAAS